MQVIEPYNESVGRRFETLLINSVRAGVGRL